MNIFLKTIDWIYYFIKNIIFYKLLYCYIVMIHTKTCN
jgi:hypothetical protein